MTIRALGRLATPLIGATLLSAAGLVLVRECHQLGFTSVRASFGQIPGSSIAVAGLLTALSYLVLTLHDGLACNYARVTLRRTQIGLASFVGYAVSNNVGFAVLSGTIARYRFYRRWGLTTSDLSRVVVFYTTTFWIGLGVLGGLGLTLHPPSTLAASRWIVQAMGVVGLGSVVIYLGTCFFWRRPLQIARWTLPRPEPHVAVAQLAVSTLDWVLCTAVLWVLLPAPRPPLLLLAGVFTLSQLAGLVSHVPGGLGVFEGSVVLLLRSSIATRQLLPALVVYRLLYYVLPLMFALAVLVIDEARERRAHLARWGRTCHELARLAAAPLISACTFLAGAVLLFSGATPALPGRISWLTTVVPVPVIELSHFTGSLLGLFLLVISRSLLDRVDAAYYLAGGGLLAGAAASLLKGADWEESLILCVVFAVLLLGRRHFNRRARIFDRPFEPAWLVAVVSVVAGSIWLGLFAYEHVAYRHTLWWQFAAHADAPRFLRASVGLTIAMFALGLRGLLRPIPRSVLPADGAELESAETVVRTQPHAAACLVLTGDKSLLWNASRTAFVMYARRGRSLVAMGDPVGQPEDVRPLIEAFLKLARESDLTPVFYEASRECVPDYAEFGLTVIKIGEEARVPLAEFSLAGSTHKALRSTLNKMQRDGCTFEVVHPPDTAALVTELATVSDDWLTTRATAEKAFSLGFFDSAYLERLPVAVIRRGNRIEAFANLWLTDDRSELSIDLMRYRQTAPPGTMDALFAHLMLWARQEGYAWFNLGMAPLSGLPETQATQTWARLGRLLYRYGGALYNFKGLRAYKNKFSPVWTSRYLVYGGHLTLPRVVADITALVNGGARRGLRGPRVA